MGWLTYVLVGILAFGIANLATDRLKHWYAIRVKARVIYAHQFTISVIGNQLCGLTFPIRSTLIKR